MFPMLFVLHKPPIQISVYLRALIQFLYLQPILLLTLIRHMSDVDQVDQLDIKNLGIDKSKNLNGEGARTLLI